jgi:hypothetical protein
LPWPVEVAHHIERTDRQRSQRYLVGVYQLGEQGRGDVGNVFGVIGDRGNADG